MQLTKLAPTLMALTLAALLGGCAITPVGKGFKLVDKMEYAKALPYMEGGGRSARSTCNCRTRTPVSWSAA